MVLLVETDVRELLVVEDVGVVVLVVPEVLELLVLVLVRVVVVVVVVPDDVLVLLELSGALLSRATSVRS